MMPGIIRNGEISIKKGGKGREYSLVKDGVRYRAYTEIHNGQEYFCDFYTNKKGNNIRTSEAQEGNTQLSARAANATANSDAKVAESSGTANIESGKSSNTELFKSSDGKSILGWAKDGKIYLTKAERNQVKAGGKEKNRDDTIKAPPLQKA